MLSTIYPIDCTSVERQCAGIISIPNRLIVKNSHMRASTYLIIEMNSIFDRRTRTESLFLLVTSVIYYGQRDNVNLFVEGNNSQSNVDSSIRSVNY